MKNRKISTLKLLSGTPIVVEELNLIIHQPTLKEIAYIGESNFTLATSILNIKKEALDLEEEEQEMISELRDIDVVYMFLEEEKNRVAFDLFLEIILKEYEYDFLENGVLNIYLEDKNSKGKKKKRIFNMYFDQRELEILREYINEILLITSAEEEAEKDDYNPQSEHAKRIAEKMRAGRRKIAELESKKTKEKNTDGLSNLVSSLATGLSLSINSVMDYTIYQLYDQMARLGKMEASEKTYDAAKFGADVEFIDWREDLGIRK